MRSSVQRLGGDFGRVWFATAATALGVRVTAVALPLLAVLTLHVSPGQVGAIATVQWLPFLLIALPLGVLFDRRRRRPLLVAAEAGRAAVLLALVVLALLGALGFELLVVLALVLGCFSVLYEVGYQSYLPSVVPPERLEVANSRLQSTESVALIAGPGLGGLLVQVASAAGALGVQVVTSVVSALTLARIRGAEVRPAAERLRLLPAIAEGVRFLLREPVLRWAVGFSAIYNLFEQWIVVLFTIDAVRRLGLSAGQFGLVLSIGAVGALFGAAAAPAVSRRLGALQACLWCSAVDVVFLVLPLAQPSWGAGVLIAALGGVFAVNGFTGALSSVILLTVRQIRVPDTLRGRVNATTRAISYGSITVGAAAGGLAGQLVGVRAGLAVGCVGLLSSLVWTIGLGGVLLRRGVRIDVPYDTGVPVPPAAGWCFDGVVTGHEEARVVSASREIAAGSGAIFELIADPARQPLWDGNDNLDEAPAGQRVRRTGDVFLMRTTRGRMRENHVVEFEEGRRIAWRPAEPGQAPPGHLWRWELDPIDASRTRVTHTYDWTRLTDEKRLPRARGTTSGNLRASLDRLAALAEATGAGVRPDGGA